jgi:hypothetical protein
MSWLGKLFGGDGAASSIIDQTFGLIDKSFYTKQEQGEALMKAEADARQMTIQWLESTSGSRLARRVIAFSITGTWLFMFMAATTSSLISIWVGDVAADKLLQSTEILDGRIETMTPAVMLILGFYFAAPYMGDLAKGALQKFGNAQK